MPVTDSFALPSLDLARQQHQWLQGARSRMLRTAGIARRKHVLDLGCGWGFTSRELSDRTDGQVTALDCNAKAIEYVQSQVPAVQALCGDASQIPLADSSVDLVFTQCAFLWFEDSKRVVTEIRRVLSPGGSVVCIEPDFGGLMESPHQVALRDVWCSALVRAGGHPTIGRQLSAQFQSVGMVVNVWQLDRVHAFEVRAWDFLDELSLTDGESERLRTARAFAESTMPTIHLPFWMLLGE